MDPTTESLIAAAKTYAGAHCCDGPLSDYLTRMALAAAAAQARRRECGHPDWDRRFRVLYERFPGMTCAEIAAESWRWQKDLPLVDIAEEMFFCWQQSEGHWRVASQQHRLFGAGMAQDRRGTWYATILVAD